MRIFNLLQVKYNQFTTSAKSYLSKTLSNFSTSYGNATVFGQLINVLGDAINNIILYIEDSLVEQNKYTAQRKKSIFGLATLSGYTPSLGKAAGAQLKFTYTPTNIKNTNIKIRHRETLTCTQNGLQYNIILPQESIVMSIDKFAGSSTMYAVQGRFETQKFVSEGGKYYTINVRYAGSIDTEYVELYINGEKWEQVNSFYDMVPDGKQYVIKVSYSEGIDILFGNDRYGRSMKDGDGIEVTYLLHDGEAGNLSINNNTYFVFDDQLQDINGDYINGNDIFNVTFATNDPVTSGSNIEEIEQTREMIGMNSRSLVLASPDNYKMLINRLSFCGYNRTWSDSGSMNINSMILKNYSKKLNAGGDYFTLTEKDFILSDSQKESIMNYMEKSGSVLAGMTYNIIDPILCKYAMYVYIKLKTTTYDKNYIKSQIKNVIGEFFSNVENDIYIAKSDIIHAIKSKIDVVDGVNVYFLSEMNEKAIQQRQYIKDTYSYNIATGTYDKKSESIYLYDGENPNIGLDAHGNIYLENNYYFPVLLGGWDFLNSEGEEVMVNDPLNIIFE